MDSRKKIIYVLALTLALSSGNSLAQERGGYAGEFLRLGAGARAIALGGAYITVTSDAYSGYYNPAGLPDMKMREVAVSSRKYSLDRSFNYIGYAAPLPPQAGMSLSWINAGIDKIDGRNSSGVHTGFLSNSQNSFMFAFGVSPHEKFSMGIGGEIVRNELLEMTGKGFGLNLGVLYKFTENIRIAGTVRDLGAHYTWNSSEIFGDDKGISTVDDFPSVYSGGISFDYNKYKTVILSEVFKNVKNEVGYRVGIESYYYDKFIIRGGLNNGDIAAGFGLEFPMFQRVGIFDYAVMDKENDPEINHVLSIKILF